MIGHRFRLAIIVCVLVTIIYVSVLQGVEGRRSGGGRRFGSSRKKTSYRRPAPPPPRYPTNNNPYRPTYNNRPHIKPSKPKIKSNSGFKNLAKVAVAAYVLKKMTPKIKFGRDYNMRPRFCKDCISINGSNPLCESGFPYTPGVNHCFPSSIYGYCTTEYGRTSDDQFYMRRSCNHRSCDTCTNYLNQMTGSFGKKCYVYECSICNSREGCNNRDLRTTFSDDFEVEDDSSGEGSTEKFQDDNDGGGCASIHASFFIVITSIVAVLGVNQAVK